mgnify:FL=1
MINNNTINGFNTTLSGKPIPPRPTPYVAKLITPCKTGAKAAKVIAFCTGQMSPPTKVADTNKSQALRMASI